MKKKLLSFALCLTMVATSFTAFPVTTNAAEPETVPQDVVATEEQTVLPEEQNVVPEEAITDTEVLSEIEEEPIIENENVNVNENENMVPEKGTVDKIAEQNVVDTPKAEPADKVKEPADKQEDVKETSEKKDYNTVVFTEAGPFMPAVDVTEYFKNPFSRMAMSLSNFALPMAENPDKNGNGLVTDKKSVANGDGTYTITMESYATGKVTSTETTTPADICIVVDQSESMLETLGGTKKSEALKKALHNFIGNVAGKQGNGGSHRIAIEGYADNVTHNDDYLHTGWITVDQAGAKNLNDAVDGMKFVGRNTDIRHGMDGANELMKSKYNPPEKPNERQKVVIVFTDGYPSTLESTGVNDDFDIGISNACVLTANDMKKAGVTIYSVGMFDGANPNELFGTTTDGMGTTCSGKMNESWAHKDKLQSYNPASNRLLNYVSSNVSHHVINASNDTYDISLGLDYSYTAVGMADMHKFEIRSILHKTQDGYYLTANDEASLDNVFQTIVENVATPSIDLGKEAVLKDVVTEYFDMPANTKDIKVYTAAYDGKKFGKRTEEKSLKPTVNGNTVKVTGFDYNENFVSENAKPDKSFGKKLIVEFNVKVKDGFLGGNGVPTNEDTSGVYRGSEALDTFEVPTVDVPLKKPDITAPDKNVYLNGNVSNDTLKSGVKVTFGGKTFTELDPWQKAYVNEPVVNVTGGVDKAKEDGNYSATVTLSPKNKGTYGESSNTATGNINVYKPEITFKDLDGYYGDNMPVLKDAFVGDTEWKHNSTNAKNVTMEGKAPSLVYSSDLPAMTYIDTTKDIPVKVTAKIGAEDVTKYVTFKHQDCNPKCEFDSRTEQFLVHVKTCTLKVTKTLTGNLHDSNDKFIMHVKGNTKLSTQPDVQFTINGGATKTIINLPVGTYTVTEDADWSKRYKVTYVNGSDTLSQTNDTGELIVNNELEIKNWLSDVSTIVNKFTGVLH